MNRIYNFFYEEQDKREYEIIKNIYHYSESIIYGQALLLIGSGHRETIYEKINTPELERHVKLNWILFES